MKWFNVKATKKIKCLVCRWFYVPPTEVARESKAAFAKLEAFRYGATN